MLNECDCEQAILDAIDQMNLDDATRAHVLHRLSERPSLFVRMVQRQTKRSGAKAIDPALILAIIEAILKMLENKPKPPAPTT